MRCPSCKSKIDHLLFLEQGQRSYEVVKKDSKNAEVIIASEEFEVDNDDVFSCPECSDEFDEETAKKIMGVKNIIR